VNAEDARQDEDIRAKDGHSWDKDIKSTEAQNYYLIDKITRAGELQ
jgi:hypothetical protein